jgi:uncharacterized protein
MNRFSAWIERNMPKRDEMERNRWIRPFAGRVLRPELWRFTRRSVPRGVALGMLTGIIIPFAQILFSALLALPVRANVPVAAVTTFITNPFTTPLIWVLSYKVGEFVLRVDAMTYGRPVNTAVRTTELDQWLQWLTGAASITAFGLVVVAVVAAAMGYVLAAFGWRVFVARKRRRRLHKADQRRLNQTPSPRA